MPIQSTRNKLGKWLLIEILILGTRQNYLQDVLIVSSHKSIPGVIHVRSIINLTLETCDPENDVQQSPLMRK